MTFADDGFLSSPHCFIFPTSPPSSPRPGIGMHPTTTLGPHSWPLNPSPPPPSDLWLPEPYCTPNRCTALSSSSSPSPSPSRLHDYPTFDPACIWALSPVHNNLGPGRSSPDQLKHVYPSPPPTDSDPRHTVPLPALSEDSPSHAAGTSCSSQPISPNPLTLPSSCTPAPLTPTQDPEGSTLTSHASPAMPVLLPLSPPPSLPMVPHALPEPITPCCTPSKGEDAHDDADVQLETDAALRESRSSSSSSSSPDEPPPSDLLTPLSPIWDLPLDDTDPRPPGTLEVSTLLSRSLVSPIPRFATSSVQATEGDRMTLPCGTNPSILDLDSRVESQCGHLRPCLVVPPGALASARFSMTHTFMPSPNFDGFPPSADGFLGHSYPASGGKLFVDSSSLNLFLSDTASPLVLPQLTLLAQPVALRRRLSLSLTSPQELATDTRDTVVSRFHGTGASPPSRATLDMAHCASAPCSHEGTVPSFVTSDLFRCANGTIPDPAPPSPPSKLEGSSTRWPDMSETSGFGTVLTADPEPMDLGDADFSDNAWPNSDDLEQDVTPSSPMHRTLSPLHDDDEDFASSSVPLSPSRRSFTDLPEDTAVNEQSTSPPQSPLLVGQPLLTLPGAEPDNSLITAETPVSDWPEASPPRGSGLGLFLPIQAASSNQPEASEMHAIEPNLNFSPEAIARVDSHEFEKLRSVRRRTWVAERKAKEDEVFHAKRAEYLAGRLSVAPPVPSKLADFDERGGVSAGADADETEGPPAEPAQLDESDEKTIRTWLLFTEARRAEARRIRKREKERGRELKALLRLKLGEDPDATDCTGSCAKVKPGKTAIVSMPQLVARMIMKRRDTPRPFSPRKHDAPISSPLSRFEPTVWDEGSSDFGLP